MRCKGKKIPNGHMFISFNSVKDGKARGHLGHLGLHDRIVVVEGANKRHEKRSGGYPTYQERGRTDLLTISPAGQAG